MAFMGKKRQTNAIAIENITGTLPPRFWSKVQKTATCWLWTGATSKGYPLFWWEGRTVAAHRLCFESLVGLVPDDIDIDHVCRNRRCVRPDSRHLRAVDHRTNVIAGIGTSAINAAKVCCPKGHPFSTVNRGRGVMQRRCLTCHKERESRRYYEKRGLKVGQEHATHMPRWKFKADRAMSIDSDST